MYVLEVNPRASRTVPYLSKATGVPLAKIAALVMAGKTLSQLGLEEDLEVSGVFVKTPVFPFVRFPGVDTILGPEMKSTGEVMGGVDDVRRGIREGAAVGRAAAAGEGHGVHQREQRRQAERAADRAQSRGPRISASSRRAAPRHISARTAFPSRWSSRSTKGGRTSSITSSTTRCRSSSTRRSAASRSSTIARCAASRCCTTSLHHDADGRVGGGRGDSRACARRRSTCGRFRTTTPRSPVVAALDRALGL